MGLKSLILLNKNTTALFYNDSIMSNSNFNRYLFTLIFLKKLFYNYFNFFFFFSIFKSLKNSIKIKNKLEKPNKILFFGKIHIFIYQKWFIILTNLLVQNKKELKNKMYNFVGIFKRIKKNCIEL